MTPKETIYLHYMQVHNTYDQLYGKNTDLYRTDNEFVNSQEFKNMVRNADTIQTIQGKINYYQRLIDEKLEQKRTEELFNTEDGAKYMSHLTDESEKYREQRDAVANMTEMHIDNLVKNLLGDDWGARFTMGSIEIGLLSKKDGYYFIFGHNFTLLTSMYGDYKKATIDDMTFSFSCGSMMAFPIFNSDEGLLRKEFEIGKGKFLSNTQVLLEIREKTFNAMVEIYRLNEIYDELINKMKHATEEDLVAFMNENK